MFAIKKKVVVLSGAGISAESGIRTFRDAGGLWEGHDINEVATPQGFAKNPGLVQEFYNQRRRQLQEVEPNSAHKRIAELESFYYVVVVTQNVDNLHERAGSTNIIHLHGELNKVRSLGDPNLVYEWTKDLSLTDRCEKGYPLRPHIVWFGEEVPLLEDGIHAIRDADVVIVIGTSLQVYPAAGLIGYAPIHVELYYVDPNPAISYEMSRYKNLKVLPYPASLGMEKIFAELADSDYST